MPSAQIKEQQIGIKPYWCLQGRKDLNILPSLFSWWVAQAGLEWHKLRLEAEQAGTSVEHAGATRRVNPLKSSPGAAGLLQVCGQQVLQSSYWKITLEVKWAKTAKQQESCNPLWSTHERSAALQSASHPLRGPLCHLLVSISQRLWRRGKVSTWMIQGCSRRRR